LADADNAALDEPVGSECGRSASAKDSASYVECRRGLLLMAVALDVAVVEGDDSGEVRRLTAPPPPALDDSEDDVDEELMTGNNDDCLVFLTIPWKCACIFNEDVYLLGDSTDRSMGDSTDRSVDDVPQRDMPGQHSVSTFLLVARGSALRRSRLLVCVGARRPSNSVFLRKRNTRRKRLTNEAV
jgi:hypothetical protein